MIYDLDQLDPTQPMPVEQCYQYKFKHPDRRREALLGIIKLLRGPA
jgi:hypothetical protein